VPHTTYNRQRRQKEAIDPKTKREEHLILMPTLLISLKFGLRCSYTDSDLPRDTTKPNIRPSIPTPSPNCRQRRRTHTLQISSPPLTQPVPPASYSGQTGRGHVDTTLPLPLLCLAAKAASRSLLPYPTSLMSSYMQESKLGKERVDRQQWRESD
jgi:hypothetical protein